MVLDEETIESLPNTCHEILCGVAVDSNNSLKRLSSVWCCKNQNELLRETPTRDDGPPLE